ncbi:CRE-JAC-1 protein [Caenorhabditis remanei]|uniref:CRE-JAC-1 protein n=1 Tax=Caenorhabditis remanei TaxID=31234 RepID=E3N614_CAERE|nr:CRE-JAC-1 protein [Caenorhabditis remanei]
MIVERHLELTEHHEHHQSFAEVDEEVTNLTSHEVQFRVSAYGRTGFGPTSNPSLPVKIPISENDLATSAGAPLAPGRPSVIAVDGQGVLLEWTAPVADVHSSPPQGYQVEYRVYGSRDWMIANEQLVQDTMFTVESLRPNGVYEFRVRGKNQDGLGHPSLSSGGVAIRPAAPQRNVPTRKVSESVNPPGQPSMVEAGDDWVKLEWAPSAENAGYIVEYREVGDPTWHTANYDPIVQNGIQVEGLRRNSTYEFCVISVIDAVSSHPSETSDVINLRPQGRASSLRVVPEMTEAPEFLDIDGDKITICWLPAHSQLPVMGYDVEFRDLQQDDRWYKVNDQPVFACKMTVGDLILDHDYQFRVLAHNASGCSQPSPPSQFVHIEPSTNRLSSHTLDSPNLGHNDIVKYVEANRFGAVPLLQEEMVRESPPLPERDDSPPPLRRANNNVQWRDPSLKEVIEYLSSQDKDKQLNASGYLQHLTYSDNLIKEETRELGGIPKLIALLRSDTPRIQKNACACLKNLSYGKENDANKLAVMEGDGVRLLAEVLRTTHDASVKEEATAALWNLSSADMLKPVILESATEILSQQVIAPIFTQNGSGTAVDPSRHFGSTLFKNSTGILRNVSAASQTARRRLRDVPNLIEALVHFLTHSIQRTQVDTPTVENAVCLLRNLSYRIQEVVDPNYDPAAAHINSKNMKHAASPKPKKKEKEKKKDKDSKKNPKNIATGPSVLWQPHVVKLYLKLLQDSSNIETLEASAGAIQNLAACQFPPSAEVRAAVRVEKGLPVLVELIRLPEDFVVCAVATALRNLAIDPRNRELIGKYALREFLDKLPEAGSPRRSTVSDQTIGAVLGILFEIVRSSAAYTKDVHELKGTDKLRALSRSYPTYSHRVCKYASQVLYVMWQHKELHDGFKRSGLKEADFYSGTARRGDSSTLARPISSQGRERPSMHNLDETLSSGGGYGTMDHRHPPNSNRPASATSQTIQRRYDQVPSGPVYASVNKQSPRGNVDDSWV